MGKGVENNYFAIVPVVGDALGDNWDIYHRPYVEYFFHVWHFKVQKSNCVEGNKGGLKRWLAPVTKYGELDLIRSSFCIVQ